MITKTREGKNILPFPQRIRKRGLKAMKSKNTNTESMEKLLAEVQKSKQARDRMNKAIQRAAKQEAKRKDGEFSALFLSAIRF